MKTQSSPFAHSSLRVESAHVCAVNVPSISDCRNPDIEVGRATTCIENIDICNVRKVPFGHMQSREGAGLVFGTSPSIENWSMGVKFPIEGS